MKDKKYIDVETEVTIYLDAIKVQQKFEGKQQKVYLTEEMLKEIVSKVIRNKYFPTKTNETYEYQSININVWRVVFYGVVIVLFTVAVFNVL